MTVYIDTSKVDTICVALKNGEKHIERVFPVDRYKAQVVLPMIEALLKENDLTLLDISHIEVVRGPGSFTGLRVGITIANTLGTLLGVPVNDLPVGHCVNPLYES